MKTIIYAIIHAIAAALYVASVVLLMTSLGEHFGSAHGYLGPFVFLLLFVISATIMGLLIFWRPLLWYLAGAKREAVELMAYTIGFLALIAAATILLTITEVI